MSAIRRGLLATLLALAAAATAACATQARPRATGADDAGPRAGAGGDDTISMVTLNIFHDRADWPRRLPLIVDGLRALQPDVIALQEVLQTPTLPNQARTIADALGYRLHFASTSPADAPTRYGNAILTPHPITVTGERALAPHEDGRISAHARVDIRGRPVDVFAVHLHHLLDGDAMRAVQVQDLLAHVDATPGRGDTLLLGDFNARIAAPALAPLMADYVDAYGSVREQPDLQPANTTLNQAFFETGSRIDHVLPVRTDFAVVSADIVFDAPSADGTWPSDHFGLHAVLRPLRASPPAPAPATPPPPVAVGHNDRP